MQNSTYSSSLLKLILMGAVLIALFAAAAGSSLFFANGAGAQESAATDVTTTTVPSAEATDDTPSDEPSEAAEAGHRGPWGNGQRPQRGNHGRPLAKYISKDEIKTAIATTLGMTSDELQAARQAGTTLEELAEQKGVTTEQLQAAVRPIFEKGVAQAVTDGVLTQEQADEMLANEWPYGNGFWGGQPRSGGRGHHGGPLAEYISHDEIKTAIATTLGMTTDELKAAKQAGTTMEELAQQKGVTPEQLQAAVRPIIEAGVAQAVADGVITQEQADEIVAKAPMGMPGGGMKGHGGKGWNNQQRPNFAPATTPETNA